MTASPETGTLEVRMGRWVARFADRVPDWEAFEEAKILGYHRAQHRYVGAGASGKYGDPNAIPPGNFTVSVMLIPPGQGNPPHTHEVEEVFFVLEGELTCFWCEGDERVEQTLARWDMVFNPADVVHGYQNNSGKDVYLQIMLGRPRPEVPSYVDEGYERAKYDHLKDSPLPLGEAGGARPGRARTGEGALTSPLSQREREPTRLPSPPSGERA